MLVPVAFIIVVLVWASTPLALKFSSDGISFIDAALLRMAIGGLVSYGLVKLLRIPLPWHKAAVRQYLFVCISLYASMMAAYWAVQWIPSGLLAVMYGLSPLVTGVLSMAILGEHTLNRGRVIALLIAVAGLTLVFSSQISSSGMSVYGLFIALASVFFWALSAVLLKGYSQVRLHPLAQTTGGLMLATPMYGLTHWLAGTQITADITQSAIMAILYLGVFGSTVGFISYYYLLQKVSAEQASLPTLLSPILALLLGHWVASETLGTNSMIGIGLVMLGLALYQWPKLLAR